MLGLGGFRSSPRTRNLIIWIIIKFFQTWFQNVRFLLYPRSFRVTWLNESDTSPSFFTSVCLHKWSLLDRVWTLSVQLPKVNLSVTITPLP